MPSIDSQNSVKRRCGAYRVRIRSCKTNQHRQKLWLSFHHQ